MSKLIDEKINWIMETVNGIDDYDWGQDKFREELLTTFQEIQQARDELWEKRVLFVLFQEGSLTKSDADKVVENLSNGKIDGYIKSISNKGKV